MTKRHGHFKTVGSLAQKAGLRNTRKQNTKIDRTQVSSFLLESETSFHENMKEKKEAIIAGGIDLSKPTALRREVESYVTFLNKMIKKAEQHEVERLAQERDSWQNLLDKTPAGQGLKALLKDAA